MANGWTPERRTRQAELIRTWRPWEKSTGPRTSEGKTKVAGNAYKGGKWRVFRDAVKHLNQALREQKDNLQEIKR